MPADQEAVPSGSGSAAAKRVRSVAEIEADIAVHRESLIETVSQLQVAVKVALDPQRMLMRQLARIRGFYVDEYGGVRPERVAVTIGVVVTVVVIRRAGRRRRESRA